eukprot:712248_1
METKNYCDFEDFDHSFIEIILFLIIYMFLQLLLFAQTMFQEYQIHHRTRERRHKPQLSIRAVFIALQVTGFYFTLIDLLRYVLDPYTHFAQNNASSCSLLAYSPKVSSIIYYGLYLISILLRLETSFRGSAYAINRTTYILLALFIILPGIIAPIVFFVSVRDIEPCVWKWTPSDMQVPDNFAFCDFHSDAAANLAPMFGVIWIVIANIVYGVIFTVKLNAVLTLSEGASGSSTFALKSLIIKNTILTVAGSVSTLINWMLWFANVGISFLYLDIWFNCVIISLMFKYNDKYYKRLCKVCIVCCLMRCDRTYNKEDAKQCDNQRKVTEHYLEQRSRASAVHSTTSVFSPDSLPSPSQSPRNAPTNGDAPLDLRLDLNEVEKVKDDGIITPKQQGT